MLKNALVKLLKVKSIITIVLTGCFAYLSVSGKINTENFMDIFKLVTIFYFGSQVGKHEALEQEKEAEENGKGET